MYQVEMQLMLQQKNGLIELQKQPMLEQIWHYVMLQLHLMKQLKKDHSILQVKHISVEILIVLIQTQKDQHHPQQEHTKKKLLLQLTYQEVHLVIKIHYMKTIQNIGIMLNQELLQAYYLLFKVLLMLEVLILQ